VIRILRSAALNSVQDLGRARGRRWGVGKSGAMDPTALRIGNLLLGNDAGEAGIEIAIFPFELTFEVNTAFAITGASAQATLDGEPLPANWARRVKAGQTLTLQAPRHGVFAYLTFAGGLDIDEVLGARATDLKGRFGGLNGAALNAGQSLGLRDVDARTRVPAAGYGMAPGAVSQSAGALRVISAAEWEAFDEASRAAFTGEPWTVSREMNRQGYKLTGPTLNLIHPLELLSHGITPGVVQVPPAGQPMVQMAEANTCGGYPKLATIIDADLGRLAQTRPGEHVRFELVDWATGVAAGRALDRQLSDLDIALSTARGRI
jgi:biotin-dependent carboxylase-like uncharacterized protein